MQKKQKPFLSLAIPFYNEEENARECIKQHAAALSKAGIAFEIIAVDNGSIDATGKILDSLKSKKVKAVHLSKNAGYGGGIMHGWLHAKGNYLGFTCGDNEIAAESVVAIMQKMLRNNLDFGKGRRVLRTYSAFRKFESWAYNFLLCRLLLGYKHSDINGYPKIMRRQLFRKLGIESKGPFFDTEMMLKASELNAKIGDVTVEYRKRTKGESNVSFYIALFFLSGLLRFKLNRLLKKIKQNNAS